MRNALKKIGCAVLAAAMCLSFAGCYSENKTWAARKGDDTLPIGAYIYYLTSAYGEAAEKVPDDQEVLKAAADFDEDGGSEAAEDWIRERAKTHIRAYYFITDKFNELGQELSSDELASAESLTDTMWGYYKTTLEDMGIAKESYNKAYSLYNARYEKVFDAVYGKGGEFEVGEDELKAYYTENYVSYEYFTASLSKTDDEGNSVEMTDDEKSETRNKLEGYLDKIDLGDMTLEEAAADYAEEVLGGESSSTYSSPSSGSRIENLSDTIKTALDGIADDEYTIAESSTAYYVIHKLPIADKFEEIKDNESTVDGILHYMKDDEFEDYVMTAAAKGEGSLADVQFNDQGINSIKISRYVTDSNKMGTASTDSDEDAGE